LDDHTPGGLFEEDSTMSDPEVTTEVRRDPVTGATTTVRTVRERSGSVTGWVIAGGVAVAAIIAVVIMTHHPQTDQIAADQAAAQAEQARAQGQMEGAQSTLAATSAAQYSNQAAAAQTAAQAQQAAADAQAAAERARSASDSASNAADRAATAPPATAPSESSPPQ
jgi:uncharacterized membrane protein